MLSDHLSRAFTCDWLQMESNVFSYLEMEFIGGVCGKLNKHLLGITDKLGNACCVFVCQDNIRNTRALIALMTRFLAVEHGIYRILQ